MQNLSDELDAIIAVDSYKDPKDVPTYDMDENDVEDTNFKYSDRSDSDFVLSGPFGSGQGPGRYFTTARAAQIWVHHQYGLRVKGKIREAEKGERWAFLIRKAP